MTERFVPAPNVTQVEMVYNLEGQLAENVYHVRRTAAPDVASFNALLDIFQTWENAHMLGARHTSTSLVKLTARDIAVQSGFTIDRAPNPIPVGTNASGHTPNNVTIAIKWITGRGGRSYRGRTFHIGLPQGYIQDSNLLAAGQSALTSGYQSLLDAISAASLHLVVVSKHSGGAVRPGDAVVTDILAPALSDSNLDSQRRRLPGRGK